MTDRINAVIVVLEENIRIDECDHLLNAIRCLRGVLKVEPHVANADSYIAEMRAKTELFNRMHALLLDMMR